MILPQSYQAVLFLMVLSLLCLGSWASAFKFAGNWRFELFYLDFAIGLFLAAVIFAFTLGDIGYDGFNFLDDLQRSEEHTSELQSLRHLVCRLLLEKRRES